MGDLTGQTALVTGAGSGIGRATALALAAAGVRLVLCDREAVTLAETRTLLPDPAACLFIHVADVADRTAMAALAAAVHDRVPALDILVNNAGVGLTGGILHTTLDDWDWVLRINLGGVIHGCHFFLPAMIQAGRGHVVNVSSALGYWAAPQMLGYATSKFAVIGLSESLRAELAPLGIGVSVICPGLIDTRILAGTRLRGDGDPEATRAHVSTLYRQRRFPPERVAAAILTAIRRNRAVVPVSPEAWLLYYLKRFLPGLSGPLGRWLSRRALPPAPQTFPQA